MRREAATISVTTAHVPPLQMRRTRMFATTTILVVLAALPRAVHVGVTQGGSTIEVSSTCSLFEAIHSANFDSNIAFAGHDPDAFRTTGCTPGSGDDTIVLPAGAVLRFTTIYNDAYSPFGRAALPIVFSKITIEGNGARLEAAPPAGVTFRAFNVGEASIEGPDGLTRTGKGNLTLSNLHIKGFAARGGDGRCGGGGGMGAGGAVYAGPGSVLTIQNSTLEGNGAIGGNASDDGCPLTGRWGPGGGGGGMGGNGGLSAETDTSGESGAGGGGGGASGNGGNARLDRGGGGGGTLLGSAGVFGGTRCGGAAGSGNGLWTGGHNGECAGGGGGGSGQPRFILGMVEGGVGGDGAYGGGGGGGGATDSPSSDGTHFGENGGNGGFGGGGGACGGVAVILSNEGGSSIFGGGGGSCKEVSGDSPFFGGNGNSDAGGGGAGLGGAVFSHFGTVTIANSTLTGNYAVRGISDGNFGDDRGGAVFAFQGSLTILNSTIAGNENTGSHGGVAYLNVRLLGLDPVRDMICVSVPSHELCTPDGSFTLRNSIIAHNGGNFAGHSECSVEGFRITASGSGNLILQNDPHSQDACPGVVSTVDPGLLPLRLNIPGVTPTMAILQTSAAADAADLATSLATDQRGVVRPHGNGADIGAYEARQPDFVLHVERTTHNMELGETISVPITLSSVDNFMEPLSLSVRRLAPSGLQVSLDVATVTPTPDQPGIVTMTIHAGSEAVGGEHILEFRAEREEGGFKAVWMTFIVGVSTGGMAKTIDEFRLQGEIANAGVATALTSKLTVAQTLIDGGDLQAGINTLAAFGLQVRALSGKQISTDAAGKLLVNLTVLVDTVSPQAIPNPLIGTVTDAAGVPVEDATVTILNGKSIVASATTDATGLYYVARTTSWPSGTSYSVKVSLPKGYKRATPSLLTFTWTGSEILLPTFVLSK